MTFFERYIPEHNDYEDFDIKILEEWELRGNFNSSFFIPTVGKIYGTATLNNYHHIYFNEKSDISSCNLQYKINQYSVINYIHKLSLRDIRYNIINNNFYCYGKYFGNVSNENYINMISEYPMSDYDKEKFLSFPSENTMNTNVYQDYSLTEDSLLKTKISLVKQIKAFNNIYEFNITPNTSIEELNNIILLINEYYELKTKFDNMNFELSEPKKLNKEFLSLFEIKQKLPPLSSAINISSEYSESLISSSSMEIEKESQSSSYSITEEE